MNLVGALIVNIIPLYGLIGLGYIAGRWLDVNLHSLARIVIFIVAPIVVCGAMIRLQFDPRYIVLPLVLLVISVVTSLGAYNLAHKIWKNNTANLIGLGSVSCNAGYFGLPLVLALYGKEWAALYLFMNVAFTLTENTIGYYMAARGHHTVRESVIKVLRLPSLHALYIGLILNFAGLKMNDLMDRWWTYAVGTWTFVGMMLIGVALSKMPRLEFDGRLLRWLFTVKFIVWPLAGFAAIAADTFRLHLFSPTIHALLLVFATAPLMANLTAYAAQLNLHPEKAATAVLLSTLFAIAYMPAMFLIARHFGLIA